MLDVPPLLCRSGRRSVFKSTITWKAEAFRHPPPELYCSTMFLYTGCVVCCFGVVLLGHRKGKMEKKCVALLIFHQKMIRLQKFMKALLLISLF